MRRRQMLAVAGGTLSIAIAGCTGDDGDSEGDSSTDEPTDSTDEEPMGEDTDDGSADDGSGDNGTEETPEPEPAVFEVTSIDPESATATVGDMLTVTADITNSGGTSGTKAIELGVGGTTIDTQDVTLDGGESQSVEFEVDTTPLDASEYTHTISTEDSEQSGTLTLEQAGPISLEEAVQEANGIIETMNTDEDGSLSTINQQLANVESVELISPVEADSASVAREEAQRLRDEFDRVEEEIFTQVPKEINAQAQDEFGFDLIQEPDSIQTAADARQEAQEGDAAISDEAVQALNGAADVADGIEEGLAAAANLLERAAESE